jgi:hypothetical protein
MPQGVNTASLNPGLGRSGLDRPQKVTRIARLAGLGGEYQPVIGPLASGKLLGFLGGAVLCPPIEYVDPDDEDDGGGIVRSTNAAPLEKRPYSYSPYATGGYL